MQIKKKERMGKGEMPSGGRSYASRNHSGREGGEYGKNNSRRTAHAKSVSRPSAGNPSHIGRDTAAKKLSPAQAALAQYDAGGVRLQKYIADCGLMSRRAAEDEIRAGNVTVNGETAEIGTRVYPLRDIILLHGERVLPSAGKEYILLNKPTGYVTTMSDEHDRRCVASLVEDVGCRVYPCGRLDMDSEGLLIMTNDGDLANKLTHPKHSLPKIYHVKVSSEITFDQLKALNTAMEIDGYTILPVLTELVRRSEGTSTLRMELYEGRNRQIRKMCEQVGLDVLKLRRIAIGNIKLGDLRAGKWRRLTDSEVAYLKGIGSKT